MSTEGRAAYSNVILDHYKREAEEHGKDASSTMRDSITRGREVASICRVLEFLTSKGIASKNVLEVGCGNAYLLGVLSQQLAGASFTGLEYTPEMVALARQRTVARCEIVQGDVCKLPFEDGAFDTVISERCIINVMDPKHQADALREVGRVLRPGGHFLCVEAFTDGLGDLNAARDELGLPPNAMPHHNIWFDKDWFLDVVKPQFDVVDLPSHEDPTLPVPNFLSSHYFVSRVLYPAVTKREILYNTHLVRFFSFLPPMGNYSPIQFYLLKKK